jgi:hypothetical protein
MNQGPAIGKKQGGAEKRPLQTAIGADFSPLITLRSGESVTIEVK